MVNKRRTAESWKEKNRVIKRGEMDVLGFSAFSGTFPTCFKTSKLNENTNLCPGWHRGDPFVVDPVIMFSASHTECFFRGRRMCRMHNALCSAGFTNVSYPNVREGINVSTLKEDYFSFSFLGWHAVPIGENCDGCVKILGMCHQFVQQQAYLNPWSNLKTICSLTRNLSLSSTRQSNYEPHRCGFAFASICI